MTLLDFSNRVFFQWFFVRLTQHGHIEAKCITKGDFTMKKYEYYSFMGWIKPLSGYGNSFKFIGGKPWYLKLTRKKEVNLNV